MIVDESKPMPERLEAVRTVLDGRGGGYLSQFSPEQLIQKILPAGSMRLYHAKVGWFEKKPVARPPLELEPAL